MKIEHFLTKKQQKKYSLLSRLLSVPTYQVSQNQLMLDLDVSYGTLVHLFEEINHDIETAQLKKDLQLIQGRCYSQKFYGLNIQKVTAIDYLLLYYLKDSVPFILLRDMILGQKLTLAEAATQYHLSESTLRREIMTLNKQLTPYNLFLSLRGYLCLEGKEWGIRLFSATFFSKSYGTKEWVLPTITIEEAQQYISLMSSRYVSTEDAVHDVSALYLVAIAFSRMDQTDALFENGERQVLYEEDSPEFKNFLEKANNFLNKGHSNFEKEAQGLVNQVIFTLLLLNNSFPMIQKIPYFFYQVPVNKEKSLFKLGFDLLTEVEDQLPTPLLAKERLNILYQFSLIAYRYIFLNRLYPLHPNSVEKEEQGTIRKLIDTVTQFLYDNALFLTGDQRLLLKKEYIQILLTQVDWLRYKPVIYVYVMSVHASTQLSEEILRSLPPQLFNVKVESKLEAHTDLIVSDFASVETIVDPAVTASNYYWKTETSTNKQHFHQKLSLISKRKWNEW